MFGSDRLKKLAEKADAVKEEKRKNWNTLSIKEKFDEVVIGNENYKQTLASVLSGYLSEQKSREHTIVFGRSGTGKTYMLEKVLPVLDLPYTIIDSSVLVPAGYSGNTLSDSLKDLYQTNQTASDRAIIIMDEFDKISEKANGGDTHKSHSIQGELLTAVQGKKEAGIDTRNSLWIFLGAFAYTDEMKTSPPSLNKSSLLKYGFKNEVLGRIANECTTEVPTTEELLARVAHSNDMKNFFNQLKTDGFIIEPDDFDDDALLELVLAAKDVQFGMRAVTSIIGGLKQFIVFKSGYKPGERVKVTGQMIKNIKENKKG